jgi:hypothetical protein
VQMRTPWRSKLARSVRNVAIGGRQDVGGRLQERDFYAKGRQNRGHLHAGIAAADDHRRFWQPVQLDQLVGGEAVLYPWHGGAAGLATGGQNKVLSPQFAARVGQAHSLWVKKTGRAFEDQLATMLAQVIADALDVANIGDDLAHPCDGLRPLQLRLGHQDAISGGAAHVAQQTGGNRQHAGRHAAAVGAGAAGAALVEQRHTSAQFGPAQRGAGSGWPGTKHNQVKTVFGNGWGHGGILAKFYGPARV